MFAITEGNIWKRKETIKLKDIERIPSVKKARRKKESIKDPNRKKNKKSRQEKSESEDESESENEEEVVKKKKKS